MNSPQPYTYAVIKYSQDPAAGECLNIGAVLFSVEERFLAAKFDRKYERLSNAFAKFDGDSYRRFVNRLEIAVEHLSEQLDTQSLFMDSYSLDGALRDLIPDAGLSFQVGGTLAGIGDNLAEELEFIFARFVTSQYERETAISRDDEDVWITYRNSLRRYQLLEKLEQKTFSVNNVEYTFPRAFRNGSWHILESASFDHVRADYLGKKATQYLGMATALSSNPEIGKLYLLLGKPTRESHIRQYENAKRLLSEHLPIPHELIEEEGADEFAREVAEFMEQHPPSSE